MVGLGWKPSGVVCFTEAPRRLFPPRVDVREYNPGTLGQLLAADSGEAGFEKGKRWLSIGKGYPLERALEIGSDESFFDCGGSLSEIRDMLQRVRVTNDSVAAGDTEGFMSSISARSMRVDRRPRFWISHLSATPWKTLARRIPDLGSRELLTLGTTHVAALFETPYDLGARLKVRSLVRRLA